MRTIIYLRWTAQSILALACNAQDIYRKRDDAYAYPQ